METSKIDSNVLTNYLQQIRDFLLSGKKVYAFPGIEKNVEEFLVRIASHDLITFFLSQSFNDDCKSLLAEIKTELIKNSNEYKLGCTHENLPCGIRSFAYIKNMKNPFKQPLLLRQPNSIMSKRTPAPDPLSLLVTTSFKLQALNTTLKFIKDDLTLTLRYSDLSTEQADFIVKMFEQSNTESDIGLGYKTMYAPLWEAMKIFGLKYKFTLRYGEQKNQAIKCLVLEKVPILSQTNIGNQEQQKDTSATKLLTILTENNTEQNDGQITSKNDDNVTSSETSSVLSNDDLCEITNGFNYDEENFDESKDMLPMTQVLQKLGQQYLTDMFKRIQNFVIDSSASRLVFEKLTLEEMTIHQNWVSIAKKSKYRMYFDKEGRYYAVRVVEILKNCSFKIKCSVETPRAAYSLMGGELRKLSVHKPPRGFLRNIIFKKIPMSEEDRQEATIRCREKNIQRGINSSSLTASSNVQHMKESFVFTNPDTIVTKPETIVTKHDTVVTRPDKIDNIPNTSVTRPDTIVTRSETFVTRPHTNVTRPVILATKPDSLATKLDTHANKPDMLASKPDTLANKAEAILQSLGIMMNPDQPDKRFNKVTMKLIEGLSQPVNADKATKIMINMGWSGGGLGAREEGIIEPILPGLAHYLDSRKRLGVGGLEVPPKANLQVSKQITNSDYQTQILETFFELVTSPHKSTELRISTGKLKQKRGFVKHLVKSFNAGSFQAFHNLKQIDLVNKINEIMSKSNWHLTNEVISPSVIIITKTSIGGDLGNKIKIARYPIANCSNDNNQSNDNANKPNDRTINIAKGINESPPKPIHQQIEGNLFYNFTDPNDLPTKNNNDPLKKQFENSNFKPTVNNLPIPNGSSKNCSTDNQINSTEKCDNSVPFEFKSQFLEDVLLFCKEDVTQKTIKFESNLNGKEKVYIMETILVLSKGMEWNGDPLEGKLHDEINNVLNGYTINCVFMSTDSINLVKQYYFKEDTGINDAKELHNNNVNNDYCKSLTNYNMNNHNNNNSQDTASSQVANNNSQDTASSQVANNNSRDTESMQVANPNNQEVENILMMNGVKYDSVEDSEAFVSHTASSNKHEAVENTTPCKTLLNPFEKALIIRSVKEINDSIDKLWDNNRVTDNTGQVLNNSNPVTNNNSDQDINNCDQDINNCDQDINNCDQNMDHITVVIASDDEDYIICSEDDDEISINDNPKEIQEVLNEGKSITTEINDPKNDLQNVNVQSNNMKDILSLRKDVSYNDNQNESISTKRYRIEDFGPEEPIQQSKKTKNYVKSIAIVPINYSTEKITQKTAREIQILIRDAIDKFDSDSSELPLLKCDGIQNGMLLYCCFSEKSLYFIEDLLNNTDFKIIYGISQDKWSTITMVLRTNSFFFESTRILLDRIAKYNKGLNTKNWEIVKRLYSKHCDVVLVEMDVSSYNYIREANFSLYAGIDKAVFAHYWD